MAIFNPTQLAELGKKLYEEKFKAEYAPEHDGEILAIDVESQTAHLGKSAMEALLAGEAANENGFFYILKIGGPGVYKLRSGRSATRGWPFR
jgi:hypothetical protein